MISKILEVVALTGLILLLVIIVQSWQKLPQQIPVHFNFSGNPDSWGNKLTILLFPIISVVLYTTITIVIRYPHTFNYLWPITSENAARQYRLACDLMLWLKAEVIWLLAYLEWQSIRIGLGQAQSLGVAFAPVFLLLIFASVGIYFWQAYQAR